MQSHPEQCCAKFCFKCCILGCLWKASHVDKISIETTISWVLLLYNWLGNSMQKMLKFRSPGIRSQSGVYRWHYPLSVNCQRSASCRSTGKNCESKETLEPLKGVICGMTNIMGWFRLQAILLGFWWKPAGQVNYEYDLIISVDARGARKLVESKEGQTF